MTDWDPDKALEELLDYKEEPKRYCGKCDSLVDVETVHCGPCGVCKPVSEFDYVPSNQTRNRSGRSWRCKECRRKQQRARYHRGK